MRSARFLVALVMGLLAAWVLAGTLTGPTQGSVLQPAQPSARVAQSATLRMFPQIAHPGSTVASPSAAKSAMTGEFRPIRSGRKVVLQRKRGTSWVNVATRAQNGRGIAQFTAPAKVSGRTAVYRVFAVRTSTLPKVTSGAKATSAWGAADFTDPFSGTALSINWSPRGETYEPWSKRKCSKGDPRAVMVSSGALRLSVLDDPGMDKCAAYDGGEYLGEFNYRLNGHVGTAGKKAFRYGFAAARIKFQPARGQHGAFWMQPQTTTSTNPGAEIDVIEWFGKQHPSGGMTSFVYYKGTKYGSFIKNTGQYGSDWASKYHVFSVEWTSNRYTFRIDGKETFRTTRGVSHQPEYLILSLLASDYELRYLNGSLPQHMYVDWVRYWKQ